jgi:hypothetical protein
MYKGCSNKIRSEVVLDEGTETLKNTPPECYKTNNIKAGFDVLTAVTMKSAIFCCVVR